MAPTHHRSSLDDGVTRPSVVVTGAASGIGLAMARHFAAAGCQVAMLDVDAAAGPPHAAGLAAEHPDARVTFRQCDVSAWQEQAAAFAAVSAAHGRIDVVLANAGVSEQGASGFARVAEDDGEPSRPDLRVLDVNLVGVVYSLKLAIHYMAKNRPGAHTGSRGLIVCTASNAGLYPFPVAPLYAASKAGIIGLVRSTAPAVERLGIRVNALAPAVLETNLAPDRALFDSMVVTPMQTLTDGLARFVDDAGLTGEVAEIHGDRVTVRPAHDFVDEDSRRNIENFSRLGYA